MKLFGEYRKRSKAVFTSRQTEYDEEMKVTEDLPNELDSYNLDDSMTEIRLAEFELELPMEVVVSAICRRKSSGVRVDDFPEVHAPKRRKLRVPEE